MRYLLSIILLSAAVSAYLFFIKPFSVEVDNLKQKKEVLTSTLGQLRELAKINDELLSRYNAISSDELSRLGRAMPDSPSEGFLMVEIQKLATQNGLSLNKIDITEEKTVGQVGQGAVIQQSSAPYSFLQTALSVAGSYDGFRLFLMDIEKNLRVIDVSDISFNASGGKSSTGEEDEGESVYDFSVKARTYWQK